MLKGTISFEGKTQTDVVMAIQEALTRIEAGYHSGMDSNEDGNFSFDMDGEEEDEADGTKKYGVKTTDDDNGSEWVFFSDDKDEAIAEFKDLQDTESDVHLYEWAEGEYHVIDSYSSIED